MKLSLIHKADWLKSSPHMNVFGQKQQRQIFPLPSLSRQYMAQSCLLHSCEVAPPGPFNLVMMIIFNIFRILGMRAYSN